MLTICHTHRTVALSKAARLVNRTPGVSRTCSSTELLSYSPEFSWTVRSLGTTVREPCRPRGPCALGDRSGLCGEGYGTGTQPRKPDSEQFVRGSTTDAFGPPLSVSAFTTKVLLLGIEGRHGRAELSDDVSAEVRAASFRGRREFYQYLEMVFL